MQGRGARTCEPKEDGLPIGMYVGGFVQSICMLSMQVLWWCEEAGIKYNSR